MAHFVFQCTTLLLLGDAQKGPRLTSRSKWVGETDWTMPSRPFQVSVFVSSVLSKRKSVSAPHSVRDTQRHVCLPEQLIVPPCPSPQLLCFRLPPPAAAAESGRPLQGRELESVTSVAIETPFHLLLLVISLHTTIDLPPHTHARTHNMPARLRFLKHISPAQTQLNMTVSRDGVGRYRLSVFLL